MADQVLCEQCGREIAEDSPAGLCPGCLLRTAIGHGADRTLAPLLPKLRYFDDYELLEEIARGGMGVVYRARQVSLDRIVAVKMMRPGLLATDAEIQRFRAEARTAASLQHPNIVPIHEVGEFDGLHYFSMDFVEGPSLASLVHEKPLPPTEAAAHVRTLAEAVQYAHSKGVLHRDLKPSNIVLDASGRPLITDFGLARPLNDPASGAAGSIVGTPAYMPPEQAAGQHDRISAASDVYSLGAILYELLTGVPPFRASRQSEVVRMVIEDQPDPPSQLNRGVSRELETICLRCLEKDPARRYPSAAALARALGTWLDSAAAPVRRRTTWRLAIAAAIALVTMVVFALWTERRRDVSVHGAPASESAAVVAAPVPSPEPLPSPAPAQPATPPKPQPKQPANLPVAVSIDPNTGAGAAQVFRLHFTDPMGATFIEQIALSIHDGERSCTVFALLAAHRIELQASPEGAPGIRRGGDAGSLQQLDNPVCTVNLSAVTLKTEGDDLAIQLPIVFKPEFEGPKTVTASAWDLRNRRSATEAIGQWIVTRGN